MAKRERIDIKAILADPEQRKILLRNASDFLVALGRDNTHVVTNAERLRLARAMLRDARDLIKEAGADRTLKRVRGTLTSIGGAIRHADLEPHRRARQAAGKSGA